MSSQRRIQEEIEKSLTEKPPDLKEKDAGVPLDAASGSHMDAYIYGKNKGKYDEYVTSISVQDETDADDFEATTGFKVPQSVLKDFQAYHPLSKCHPQVGSKEDDYRARCRKIIISPERLDPFADGGKTPDAQSRTYQVILREQALNKDQAALRKKLAEKAKSGNLEPVENEDAAPKPAKRRRWDESPATEAPQASVKEQRFWKIIESHTSSASCWDETPARVPKQSEVLLTTPNQSSQVFDITPAHATACDDTPGHRATPSAHRNRWDETPKGERETPACSAGTGWAETPHTNRTVDTDIIQETPTPSTSKRRSRWDETPSSELENQSPQTPSVVTPVTPASPVVPRDGVTPVGAEAKRLTTPAQFMTLTPEQLQAYRWELEIDERNRPFTDDELDSLFPQGYKIAGPPVGYVPIRTPARKLVCTPTPCSAAVGFFFQNEGPVKFDVELKGDLPSLKPEDIQYFDKLMADIDEAALTPDQQIEYKIMKLLLKIKNGSPPVRKAALRRIIDKAKEFGPTPLFNQILPLLMSPTLEDQERHLLVKVIDRVLYKLDDLVRPYVHKILVVIEPLLIDEDYYARVEGREIISNLSKQGIPESGPPVLRKAAGLATMISTMRPDIDNIDEYVRNTTARAFAVVASSLGIPALLPFLKAVCRSKKSWQARHTGIKIVQQISILVGCAILPHLRSLVEIIENGLVDEQQKVRTITALALAALAEASTPYGIESFDSILKPLWKGIRLHRGKGLAAFLKAIGYLIPLMDAEYANYYTKEVVLILIREFNSPDEEMKKIVLKVVKQCCSTEGVTAEYIKADILPSFFRSFWNHRSALDRRNYKQLVDATVEIANKVGAAEIIHRIVDDLKDENEQYRRMVMETTEKIMGNLGATDVDSRLEEQLIDGILYAFQEQTAEDMVVLNGFGTIVNALGKRVKPYLPQICGTILWRLNNKAAKVRLQAADLISRIAVVMKTCQEEKLISHLGVVLYEYLGEEYPEVLGSILAAMKGVVNIVGMLRMTPSIKDLLPRLVPILKNRHEKVQENCIDLVGRIADRGAEYVPSREWMRICFELLELLKAHKKSIRRATVNTFGYIAKAIGPHDVLGTLLNNLRVQERQNRVCTTVAIAIVAETCSPFTVLPALMNEYRVPELNVQNGVLKSLSFLFEYIGEMGIDYIYAVTPLLHDALMDRDLVHRQTACSTIQHIALGVQGFGCEDALVHLLNYMWPNIFETSPHLVQAFMNAVEGLKVALGPVTMMMYCLQGLFHPARKVREVYWKIYNTLYIAGQDSLVCGYPRVPGNVSNDYVRHELDYII